MTDDRRLRKVAHWQDTVSMPHYSTLDEWLARKEYIRQRILFSAGLLPELERTPLRPISIGRQERDGFVVENVAFESFPGFYCTGNLYRPVNPAPPGGRPAILTPHGHWQEGRFVQSERGSAPARCINFARQGYVVFSPDMVGYNDSRQIPHREFDTVARSLRGIGTLGLQLWNNIRALDYLLSLDDVDPARIGCTGESGGATQTYLLAAVDDRVGYVAPVNMLSAHYAGGCVCENAPGLRLDLTNMEVVAAAAPRPMLIVAATGDWTVNTPRVEFPAVQAVYGLFNARDRLECVQIDAGHNYNQDSREAVYGFFARHCGGNGATTERPASAVFWTGPSEPVAETPNSEIEDVAPLRVFPDGTPLPSGALQDALQVTDAISARFRARFDAALPGNSQTLEHFKSVYRPAYEHALHARLPGPDEVRLMHRQRSEMHGLSVERMDIGTAQYGEEIPAIYVSPSSAQSDAVPVLLVSPEGKRAWLSDSQLSTGSGGALQSVRQARGDAFVPLVNELLAAGRPVLIVDTFLTGEYLSPVGAAGRPVGERHFTTYNRADVAWRAQDVLTCAAALSVLSGAPTVDVVGWGDAGLWCLLARPFAPSLIRRLAADLNGFAWDAEADYLHRLCLPHVLRLGGLAGAIALAAPAPLYLQNGEVPPWLPDLYDALGVGDALSVEDRAPGTAMSDMSP